MELTAAAMSQLDENLDFRQMAAMRTVLAFHHGLLPGTPFNCNGTFVRNNFEIPNLRCMALLPSGWMIDVDENVSINIPMLNESTYYFSIGLGEKLIDFEHKDVEYVRPDYSYEILNADELKINQSLPLMRFSIKDGTFNIDSSYIPPCLMVETDEKFELYRKKISERLDAIISHPNIPETDSKALLAYYQSRISNPHKLVDVNSFIETLSDLHRSLVYNIFNKFKAEIGEVKTKEYDLNDVQLFLEWLVGQLDYAKSVLDKHPVEDNKPNYDELKEILRKELMDDLKPTLEGLIHTEVDAVRNDIQQQVSDALKDFLSGEFRRQLYADLNAELADSLYQKLYDALYKALYGALYREEEVETDEYTPMI